MTGSDETLKLMDVEKDEADFTNRLLASSYRLRDLPENSDAAAELRRKMTQDYVSYYRSRVKYILSNSHSLTVIPVLYQVVGDELPVFGKCLSAAIQYQAEKNKHTQPNVLSQFHKSSSFHNFTKLFYIIIRYLFDIYGFCDDFFYTFIRD